MSLRFPVPLSALCAAALLVACDGDKGGLIIYNTPPNATISNPPSGSSFDQYETVTFTARVGDDQDAADELLISWHSSIEGQLPEGLLPDSDGLLIYSTANLSPGNHVITLQVIDSEAESATFDVTVTINDLPESPEITLIHPASGEAGLEGESFTFQARVSDSRDLPQDIGVTFESDVDGTFCSLNADGAGLASCSQELTPGDHFLTYRASDTDGETGTVTAYFTVVARTAYDDDGDGWTEEQGDCDDDDDDIHPGATEEANGIDDDCDDIIDNNTRNYDDDGDGYSENDGDCDDSDATVYPGAEETFDGDDEDCDGLVDEGTSGYDDDGDGFTETAGDCDDGYALTYPGATELEDGEDNDCDGLVDEGTDSYDDDGDGYTERGGDCDDDDDDIHPGATETCGDGVDNDCNGAADEAGASGCTTYYQDYDGDAYGSTTASSCLCSSSGYYTSRYSNDCYDYNASANPAATSYFSSPRGDSSYDYDCDGSQTKYYSSSASCAYSLGDCYVSSSGWDGSTPSCGSGGYYATTSDSDGCSWDWGSFSCEVTGTLYVTQTCR